MSVDDQKGALRTCRCLFCFFIFGFVCFFSFVVMNSPEIEKGLEVFLAYLGTFSGGVSLYSILYAIHGDPFS